MKKNNIKSKIDELNDFLNSSICYKQNTWNKRNNGNWNKLWSAFDNIRYSQSAIDEYNKNTDNKKLNIYGILQALFVQQNAIKHLEESIEINPLNFKKYHDLSNIREIRNEIAGHPSETKKNRNKSSYKKGEITYTSLNPNVKDAILEYFTWTNNGHIKKQVNLIEIINKQKKVLKLEINRILEKIKSDEDKHKEKFKKKSLEASLSQSRYLIQKLWPFETNREYSQICFKSLIEMYNEFKKEVMERYNIKDLDNGVQIPGVIEEIKKVDKRIAKLIKMIPMNNDIDTLDLEVYVESLDNSFSELRKMAIEIDKEFNTVIN